VDLKVTFSPSGFGQLQSLMQFLESAKSSGLAFTVADKIEEKPKPAKNGPAKRRGGGGPFVLTVADAATRAGISTSGIQNAIETNNLSAKEIKGVLMVHPTSLGAYMRHRLKNLDEELASET
jgi:hypothetical protein